MPKILIFDLDETLFEIRLQASASLLSQSGQSYLSKSNEGVLKNAILVKSEDGCIQVDKVQAIARKQMEELFKKIYAIITKAKESDLTSPIAIKIITSSNYDEGPIKNILNHFYADLGENVFTSGEFPIEFFNYDCLDKNLTSYLTPLGEPVDPSKADLINKHFAAWQATMPGLSKQDVYMIDNTDFNLRGVKDAGYSTIHYPTTPAHRSSITSFYRVVPSIFAQLHALVDEEQKSLEARLISVPKSNTLSS